MIMSVSLPVLVTLSWIPVLQLASSVITSTGIQGGRILQLVLPSHYGFIINADRGLPCHLHPPGGEGTKLGNKLCLIVKTQSTDSEQQKGTPKKVFVHCGIVRDDSSSEIEDLLSLQ